VAEIRARNPNAVSVVMRFPSGEVILKL